MPVPERYLRPCDRRHLAMVRAVLQSDRGTGSSTVDARDTYLFHIDGWTPKTLPMARLAEYLAELAKLMGETERVHFERLKRGSAVVSALVERQAAPKVRRRVVQAKRPSEAADDVRRSYERLNELLRADKARGDLRIGKAKILKFPGRDVPLEDRVGPFREHTEVDGVLVRIGGTDETAHAHIEGTDGQSWACVMSREKARELAPYLYGATLRVSGSGRWLRNEFGKWELASPLKVESFSVLKDEPLTSTIERLRGIEGSDWRRERDPLAFLAHIRDGDEGVH